MRSMALALDDFGPAGLAEKRSGPTGTVNDHGCSTASRGSKPLMSSNHSDAEAGSDEDAVSRFFGTSWRIRATNMPDAFEGQIAFDRYDAGLAAIWQTLSLH